MKSDIDKLRHVARAAVDVHDLLEQSAHVPIAIKAARKFLMDTRGLLFELADKFDTALQAGGNPAAHSEPARHMVTGSAAAEVILEFEQWAKGQGLDLLPASEDAPGIEMLGFRSYRYTETEYAWRGWANRKVGAAAGAMTLIREKLERFEACAGDDEGCDIGREWFDTLTTLGLLKRTQRSPAMWSMTPSGEALLAAQPAEKRCEYCDGTGDVHDATGEWRGECNCGAAQPAATSSEPLEIERLKSALAEANQSCTAERVARELARDELQRRVEVEREDGSRWFWQGDGHDNLESMIDGMQVIIGAAQLRALLSAPAAPAPVDRQGVALSNEDNLITCPECHGNGSVDVTHEPLRDGYTETFGQRCDCCQGSGNVKGDRQ